MTFGLRHVLGAVSLLCFALVIVDADAPYGFWTYVAVAALFSVVFSIASTYRSTVWRGALGSLVGWAVAIVIGHIEFISGYWSHTGSRPYFEDGVITELVILPVYVAVAFATPCAAIGSLIGACVSMVAHFTTQRRTTI